MPSTTSTDPAMTLHIVSPASTRAQKVDALRALTAKAERMSRRG